jgi:hypothetical protein
MEQLLLQKMPRTVSKYHPYALIIRWGKKVEFCRLFGNDGAEADMIDE